MVDVDRRAILVAMTGLMAGCSILDDGEPTGDAGSPDADQSSADRDPTVDERQPSADERDPGVEEFDQVSDLLTFGGDVGDTGQRRSIRALARVQALVGEELDDTVHVQYLEPGFVPLSLIDPDSGFEGALGRTTLRSDPPSTEFGGVGLYLPSQRTVIVADPADTDRMLEVMQAEFPVDVPDDALENYPDETLLAHELCHALQFDTIPDLSLGGWDLPYDVRQAEQSVLEGTAEWIGGRYRANCTDGTYDPCSFVPYWINAVQTPSWAIHLRTWYINGAVFVHHVFEEGGWDAVWDLHVNPPQTAWAVMFPRAYLADGVDVQRPDSPSLAGDGWIREAADMVGVNGLYELLYRLGQAHPTDADARTTEAVQAATTVEHTFRSDLLRGWRGDVLSVYGDSEDEGLATHWMIDMATSDGAFALVEALEDGFGAFGAPVDEVWTVGRAQFVVERDRERIELWYGEDQESLAAIR